MPRKNAIKEVRAKLEKRKPEFEARREARKVARGLPPRVPTELKGRKSVTRPRYEKKPWKEPFKGAVMPDQPYPPKPLPAKRLDKPPLKSRGGGTRQPPFKKFRLDKKPKK